ncbi:MAG: patatin-like phospholipase family protein [Bacteroidales bacterium]|nr:patatin-like phospholipase family protein [Bacteroidales bacterium]
MKKAAVVLSSGSARGLAHIGAIEELLSRGYEITSIAGCSMGSLIAGMYASGRLDAFKDWMKTITFRKMFQLTDFSIGIGHLVKGEKIIEALEEIAPDTSIEELRIPYCAVASDLATGNEVVFRRGSLYHAIRSSISLPIFFRPVVEGQSVLVDGGCVNPLPLNRVFRTPGDILVSVNVSAPYEKNIIPKEPWQDRIADHRKKVKEYDYVTLMDKMTDLMIQSNCSLMEQLYKPEVSVSIGMDAFSSFDFDQSDLIIEEGRRAMSVALDKYEGK